MLLLVHGWPSETGFAVRCGEPGATAAAAVPAPWAARVLHT